MLQSTITYDHSTHTHVVVPAKMFCFYVPFFHLFFSSFYWTCFSHFIHLFGEVRCCCLYVTRPYYRTTPPGHVTVLLHVSAVNIADIFIGMNTQRKNKNFSTLVFYREAANEGNYGHCSHDLWLKEEVRSV